MNNAVRTAAGVEPLPVADRADRHGLPLTEDDTEYLTHLSRRATELADDADQLLKGMRWCAANPDDPRAPAYLRKLTRGEACLRDQLGALHVELELLVERAYVAGGQAVA